jgi:hypothetical protein
MKPQHPDEKSARRAAVVAGRRSGIHLSYYECPECGYYHLTRSVGGDNPRTR